MLVLTRLALALAHVTLLAAVIVAAAVALNFPYHYDRPILAAEVEAQKHYYAHQYRLQKANGETDGSTPDEDSLYVRIA